MEKLSCGCTPDASGFGYCGECNVGLRKKIWKEMSEERRRFDRHVAPEQSAELDEACDVKPEKFGEPEEYNTGCSCHINPPCSYCEGRDEVEEDE